MEFLLDSKSDLTDLALSPIVELTIVENQLHIVNELLDLGILMLLDLSLDGAEVHWILHDLMIVRNLKSLHIHSIMEYVRLGIPLQQLDYSLGGSLPLVKYGVTLLDFRNFQGADWLNILIFLVHLEVFGEVWVVLLELLKLLVSHWIVVAIILQHCEQVPSRNLPFICFWMGLLL